MAETTFTFFDSDEVEKTALAGANGSGHLAPAAVLYAIDGTQLIGQKARAASVPVTLSSEDITALTPPAAISGFATAANQSTELTTLASILAKIIASPATEAKQDTQITALGAILTGIVLAAGNNNIGDVDLASAIPAGNNNIGDVDAIQSGTWTVQPGNTANTTPWLVKQSRSATPTQSSVADTASSTTLLASNANRLGATIYNDSTAALYLKLGATASTSSFTVKMAADSYYEVPFNYTGVIDGIWASDASGSARITELT